MLVAGNEEDLIEDVRGGLFSSCSPRIIRCGRYAVGEGGFVDVIRAWWLNYRVRVCTCFLKRAVSSQRAGDSWPGWIKTLRINTSLLNFLAREQKPDNRLVRMINLYHGSSEKNSIRILLLWILRARSLCVTDRQQIFENRSPIIIDIPSDGSHRREHLTKDRIVR